MTDAPPAARSLRRTLIAGGVLLIVSAVVGFAGPTFVATPLPVVLSWAGTVAFSAAVLVFAFGVGRGGSIVARRPLAVTAAVLVAGWPILNRVVTDALPVVPDTTTFLPAFGYVTIAVTLGATIVFTVQIARSGVITGTVRWMPLWGLVAVAVPQIVAQATVIALGMDIGASDYDAIVLLFGIGSLLAFAVPVALGVAAVLVANRPAAAAGPVQVYPPAA